MTTTLSPALTDTILIERLDAEAARAAVPALAEILHDAVASGASVGFMSWNTKADYERFWNGVVDGVATGNVLLYVAREGGDILGTAQLHLIAKPNQPHRGDIAKVLVHSRARRRGLGARLMRAAEAAAREAGRDLLVLDTDQASGALDFYRELGWVEVGTIPRYALMPDGSDCATTFFYKELR